MNAEKQNEAKPQRSAQTLRRNGNTPRIFKKPDKVRKAMSRLKLEREKEAKDYDEENFYDCNEDKIKQKPKPKKISSGIIQQKPASTPGSPLQPKRGPITVGEVHEKPASTLGSPLQPKRGPIAGNPNQMESGGQLLGSSEEQECKMDVFEDCKPQAKKRKIDEYFNHKKLQPIFTDWVKCLHTELDSNETKI